MSGGHFAFGFCCKSLGVKVSVMHMMMHIVQLSQITFDGIQCESFQTLATHTLCCKQISTGGSSGELSAFCKVCCS